MVHTRKTKTSSRVAPKTSSRVAPKLSLIETKKSVSRVAPNPSVQEEKFKLKHNIIFPVGNSWHTIRIGQTAASGMYQMSKIDGIDNAVKILLEPSFFIIKGKQMIESTGFQVNLILAELRVFPQLTVSERRNIYMCSEQPEMKELLITLLQANTHFDYLLRGLKNNPDNYGYILLLVKNGYDGTTYIPGNQETEIEFNNFLEKLGITMNNTVIMGGTKRNSQYKKRKTNKKQTIRLY